MAQYWAVVLPLLFISNAICKEDEDSVADDISPHMIRRISQLLTSTECQNFYLIILKHDDDYYKILTELPSGQGQKELGIVTQEDCTKVLKNWVETKVQIVSWDRVFSALYNVGRLDIALELAKTVTQETTLGLKKNLDKLRKTSQKFKSSLIIHDDENYEENMRQVRDLNSIRDEDWDLIVERQQLPPYNRHLSEWSWSMLYGVIIGCFAAPILASLIFLVIFVMNLFDNTESALRIKIDRF